jgi:nucleotide-binding universal stress UspA family protein
MVLPTDGSMRGVEAARSRLDDLGLRRSSADVIPVTDAGSGVCRLAEEAEADLIVLGTTGEGPRGPAPLETLEREVAWRAPCSVLILRADGRTGRDRQKYVATESSTAA